MVWLQRPRANRDCVVECSPALAAVFASQTRQFIAFGNHARLIRKCPDLEFCESHFR